MARTKGQNRTAEGVGMMGGALAGLVIASNPVTAGIAAVAGVAGAARMIQGALTRTEEINNAPSED